jgi:hypothetical protein
MRLRAIPAAAALVATLSAALLGSGIPAAVAAAAPAAPVTGLAAGRSLTSAGMRSPDSRYLLTVRSDGRLTVTGHGRTRRLTTQQAADAVLTLTRAGNLVLRSRGRTVWETNTRGAAGARLSLTDAGVLVLSAKGGVAWTDVLGNGCAHSRGAHHVTVDLSRQQARLCAHHQQVLVTPVTTGASSKGDATPTGSWKVYAKVRDTVLHPADGGAYHVRYWMPYDGAYGMHDSPWQRFAYGSPLYRTRGSHGCVHFPGTAMKRLFAWAPVGTRVTVRR